MVPEKGSPIYFAMLLNLFSITNTSDPDVLWGYIGNYVDATPEDYPILKELVLKAINYYNDKVLPTKEYRKPTEAEAQTLLRVVEAIKSVSQNDEEELTKVIYEVGKTDENYGKENLRNYFQMIYEVLMGQKSGPRFPVFVMLYGLENTIKPNPWTSYH